MFPIPWLLVLIYIAVLWLIAFGAGTALGALSNHVFNNQKNISPFWSGVVSIIAFTFCFAVLIYMPGGLKWFNDQPLNFRTHLWDNALLISASIAILCVGGFQMISRKSKSRNFRVGTRR